MRIRTVLGLALSATLVATLLGPTASASVTTQRVIVMLSDSVARPGETARVLTDRVGGELGHVYTSVFKGFSAVIPVAARSLLASDSRVISIEADRIVTTQEDSLPTGMNRIELDQRLASLTTSNSVNYAGAAQVAVVDTGIDDKHPDLNVVAGVDCTLSVGCVAGFPGDGNGHGTHVAGTVAAKDNGSGVVGVAPGADLYAVRVLDSRGSGYFSWIIAGLDWIHRTWPGTIDAVNMSLGGQGTCGPSLQAALNALRTDGITVVVAAGNDGADASGYAPASCNNVISVSAVADSDGQPGGVGGAPSCSTSQIDDVLAWFSNYGSVVDIAAPGVCITSTWPKNSYRTLSGTSMATPHVTGAVALYRAQGGTKAPVAVSDLSTVTNTSACGYNNRGLSAGPMLYMGSSCTATAIASPSSFGKTSPVDGITGLSRTVTFTWGSSSRAGGYALTIYNSVGSPLKTFPVTSTSLAVSFGSRGTYKWQVVAINGGGSTPASSALWSFRVG